VDAAVSVDPTNWDDTFLSYYTYGAALGLGLDLSLRDLTSSRVSLDDFMRELWTRFGKTPGAPGTVTTPYTLADLEQALVTVSRNERFARDFFARFVNGREVVDYARLLARAGLILRPERPTRAWMGDLPLAFGADGSSITGAPRMGTPAFDAGLGKGDTLLRLGDTPIATAADVTTVLDARQPGDTVRATIRRHGVERTVAIALRADPRLDLVTVESTGGTLTPEQQAFRESWLSSKTR
jgi:predicted metalloprotease with PDZ domain